MTATLRTKLTALLVIFSFSVQPVFALETEKHYSWFSTEPRKKLDKRRNLYFPPLVSLVLPSFDQWWEEQSLAAATYLGVTLVGANLATAASQSFSDGQKQNVYDDYKDSKDYTDLRRQYQFGTQLVLFAGEMSSYHSFRTAMKTRKQDGQFEFLTSDENPGDLLLAPFAFSEALKPTTFVPLLVVTGLVIANANSGNHSKGGPFTFGDSAFVAGTSYNAGVGEEALFRGYLMPMFREGFGSNFWSNAATSLIFGAAHLGSVKLPIIQTGLGFYLGWLSQRNEWSLRQSIFLHAWWDVIALGAAVAQSKNGGTVYLPAYTFQF